MAKEDEESGVFTKLMLRILFYQLFKTENSPPKSKRKKNSLEEEISAAIWLVTGEVCSGEERNHQ